MPTSSFGVAFKFRLGVIEGHEMALSDKPHEFLFVFHCNWPYLQSCTVFEIKRGISRKTPF